MSSNVYCPFCGVILLPDPYSDDPASPQTRVRPWYAEVRGIYSTNPPNGYITITGPGIVRRRNKLYAPLDSDSSYVEVGIEALEEWGICKPSESLWCFGFHNSCWRLLLLRLGHFQNETAIAESVFYQLYCSPCFEGSSFQFGHDYQGAAQTQRSFGRPKPVDLSSHFYADPLAIPSTEDLEAIASDWKAHDGSLWKGRKRKRSNHNILDRLSSELKFEIFSYLPFGDLLSIRLVCRDLALLATVHTLPQSYWRSRFSLHQEVDFLFPSLTDTRDWSRLFFGTRQSLGAGCLPLTNRKRIRQLLEPIAALVEVNNIFRNSPSGTAFHPAQGQENYFQLTSGKDSQCSPQILDIASSFSGQLSAIGADRPLEEGCRVMYHRTQSVLPQREQNQRIGISTVQIGARSFISGMRFFPSESSVVVGYHNPASERWIEIHSSSHVKALSVAFCAEGLTAIKFVFTNFDSSDWVGDTNSSEIAYGTLSIPESVNGYCLLAGLDRYKIVSLALGELTDNPETSPRIPSRGVIDSLWTPHPPMHEDLGISTLLPYQPSQTFEPLTSIDFGGPRGLRLGTLTSLTFYMASGPHPLIGIEISYSDGRSALFGSHSGCQITFLVDGPRGERISRISILEDNQRYHPASGLGGLQISTNYERTAVFAPLHYRLNASVELIPISPDETITGLVAVKPANQDSFIRVGVQSQECDGQPMTPDILNHECRQIPDDQIRYDEKFSHFMDSSNPGNYQTYASLKNVRKILASTGIQGRSRSPNHISGLKLEYYNHPSPSIVGQWMNKLDDGFELSPEEEIQSLTIWLTPMGRSTECPGVEVGQVAALQIATTHSRSVTFRSPDSHSLLPRKLQHQYKTSPDEKLTAISWMLNVSSDLIRAVVSSNGSTRAQTLVPEQQPPFDQVRKLYFETQNNACRETIVTAEAYFQEKAIIGLVFVYTSGSTASMGDLNTDTRQKVHFAHGVRIVGLSVTVREPELIEIEFEVEQIEHTQFNKLKLSMDPVNTVEYDWQNVWCKDETSAESCQQILIRDRVYKPPNKSRMVGIYIGCQDFFRVGAIYEPEFV